MALAKKHRLNLRLHRLRVEKNSKKIHSPLFTYIIASQIEGTQPSNSRFAILISKKLAKKAVDRNKIKRKIAQAIQDLSRHSGLSRILSKNHDIILIPKKTILNKTITQISKDFNHVQNI